jgi:hypothetical protein
MRLDSLWVQNLFESYKNDDAELATISLQSTLADINDRVVGGDFGAPYSIGDHGFYVEKQFEPQLTYLTSKIKQLMVDTNTYLSESEWLYTEKKLQTMAKYAEAAFTGITKGDSFASLAIRTSSFQVAKVCLNAGIDPLITNSEGKDLFDSLKMQYQSLGLQLKEVEELKLQATQTVMVPSFVQHILDEEVKLIDNFHFLAEFTVDLKENLLRRLEEIDMDKVLQRRAMLRDEEFSEHKTWNIAQREKVERYIVVSVHQIKWIFL